MVGKQIDASYRILFLLGAPFLLATRIYWAARYPMADCDEVFNYWEPLYFGLYDSTRALQTWEYAHAYALRTYAYLRPLQWFATYGVQPLLLRLLLPQDASLVRRAVVATLSGGSSNNNNNNSSGPLAVLYILRATLAALTAACELLWIYGYCCYVSTTMIKNRNNNNNKSNKYTVVTVDTTDTEWILWWAIVSCCGMPHAASTALLPSATWMAAWMLAAAAFVTQRYRTFVVICVTATLTTGWPFGAVSVVPVACAVLYYERQRLGSLILWTIGVTVVVQTVVSVIDYEAYGGWTFATWNIFVYNAGQSNDTLYGTEPLSYYIKNLLLQWNLVAVLGLMAMPVLLVVNRKAVTLQQWAILSCLPAWLLITFPRPHKEERFLYPIYPVLCYGAVLVTDTLITNILSLFLECRQASDRVVWNRIRHGLHALVWIPCLALSWSRQTALYRYYAAPLTIYAGIVGSGGRVCTCGEWYRFPSSFYLPSGGGEAPLGFLPSSFRGQLPQPFSVHGSRPESQQVLQPFNDQNREEPDRYVTDVQSCRWVVDVADGECIGNHFANTAQVDTILSEPFLDAGATTSTLHRALYIPWLHERAVAQGSVVYQQYELYHVQPTSGAAATETTADTLEAA